MTPGIVRIVGRLAAKDPVIGGLVRVPREVNASSRENHRRREQNSRAKQVAEDEFQAAVSPRLRLKGLRLAAVAGTASAASDSSPQSFVEHLQSQHQNHQAEDEPERLGFRLDQNAAAEQRATQHS